ncbi:unnamed protein product [Brassicogethes aeneus]|uniref:Uncharacterized protein n=1 Tax=Brassicogethes aeneus TaxID=1431903 RepID=A0A9P0B4L4_BRAAE|nr:unnamed protein product [Brassicogethes aeneus]
MIFKLLIISAFLAKINSLPCPSRCTCSLDSKDRKVVACVKGGMTGSVNLDGITLETQIIKISAPEDNLNDLQMSPIFQSYKKLEEIHITRSNIPQLGLHFFWGLTKLEVLNLSQNNITQALPNNFRGLDRLKELYLDDNRIHSLPSSSFQFLKELRLLSIQRNRLTTLVISLFHNINKLRVLKLSGNQLGELNPEVFGDIKELRVLECRNCGLHKLDPAVNKQLYQLTHLDLGENEIKSILNEDIRGLQSLKNLKLDGNQIRALSDSTFVHQSQMGKLNLAHNEIARISANAFQDLHNFSELNLSHNKLESLENGSLSPIANTLEVLVLSGNHIKLNTLQDLLTIRLKELHLSHCDIADIHLQIFPDSLNVLDLSHNRLSDLPIEVIPSNLTTLDISRNMFRGLNEEILLVLDNVRKIKLDKNPWSCDLCHIVPLLEKSNKTGAYRDVVCMYPYTMSNKKLANVERSELTWCTAASYNSGDANFFFLGEDGRVGIVAASMSVCLLFLTVLVIIGALCYSRRHAAKYYTHEDKLAKEGESILENNHSPLFCDRELTFSFPGDKKISISTIDEIKKEHAITNGT